MTSEDYYGNSTIVKENCLILVSDTITYESGIKEALEEASRLIDLELLPYESTLPVTGSTILSDVANKIASGIIQHKYMPQMMDSPSWIKLGLDLLHIYIDNTYAYGVVFTWNTQDPQSIMSALDKKIITNVEARTLLDALTWDPTLLTQAELDQIEANIALINAQIAHLGIVDTKLSGADTDYENAQRDKTEAETALLSKDLENRNHRGIVFPTDEGED
jgi:hypothetical protein